MQRFVIVIDTQADFMDADGALCVPGAEALTARMQAWLSSLGPADTAGVLFTFDTHFAEDYSASPEAEQFPIHCVRGTRGWENVLDLPAIDRAVPVYRLEKGVFDMWEEAHRQVEAISTGQRVARDALFVELKARGVTDVTVIGVAADYCVRWAIEGLVERGFNVGVPPELTRGIVRSIEQVITDDFANAPVRLGVTA